jgi:hypothetical protein
VDAEELVKRLVLFRNDLYTRFSQDPQYQITLLADLAVLQRYFDEARPHVPDNDPVHPYLDYFLPLTDLDRDNPIWASDIHRILGQVLRAMWTKNHRLQLPPELEEPRLYSSGMQGGGMGDHPGREEPPASRAHRIALRPVGRPGSTLDWVG